VADAFKLAFSCLQGLRHQATWAGQGQVPINQGPHAMVHSTLQPLQGCMRGA